MEGGENNNKRRKAPIDLDWDKLFQRDDEPPALLVVTPTTSAAMADDRQRDDLESMSDIKLEEAIARHRKNLETVAYRLPDKGQKLMDALRRFEKEKERRKTRRLLKGDGGGASCGARQGASSPLPQSQFGSRFSRKMGENTDCGTVDVSGNQLTTLGRCDRLRSRQNGQFSAKEKNRNGFTSRQTAFQSPSVLAIDVDTHNNVSSNGGARSKDMCSSPGSPPNLEEDLARPFSKRNASKNLRPRNTVVVVDEEEPQLVETLQEEVDDCLKDIKIYYPSRDDPESVEICYANMECLAPEAYLSSAIMNFYMRYLQQSATDSVKCSYHFFTTYVYEKLKEAVLNKTSDKENLFVKFRRWWKGVNIFEKAYILLPIHEYHHWSLIIICIPDKEEESGPILLHLDSLGLHNSKPIFNNIRSLTKSCVTYRSVNVGGCSFLRKEWDYLNEHESCPNYAMAERIWHHLPRRIDEREITVPQQKNDYDCGVFVLFFIERFIEEAPQRLKKKDLAMFGRQWFNPREASDLRRKIRSLLSNMFKRESEDRRNSEP